jgi:5'-3' exonuclease
MTIVDTNNLIAISFNMFLKQLKEKNGEDYICREEDSGFFYHFFCRKIFPILTTYKDIIFCFDNNGKNNFRKKIYPLYKENRIESYKSDNYKFMISKLEDIRKFLSLFRCKIFIVYDKNDNKYEADDLIYKLCEISEEEIIIISTDGDFKQLINFFPYVKIYNPIKMLFLEKNENILLEKAIVGDPSDNIKGISRIGKETLKKMLEDKILWNKKMTPENIETFDTIMKIVDLRKTPQELQERIREEWEKTNWNEFRKDCIEAFFLKYKMTEIFDEWNEVYGKIQLLQSEEFSISSDEELEKMINNL